MISPFHHLPDRALLRTQEEQVPLSSSQLAARRFRDISWELAETTHGLDVSITAQETPLKELVLRWDLDFPQGCRFLGGPWERGYGSQEWRGFAPDRVMAWYFAADNGQEVLCFGVKAQPHALCWWSADPHGFSLHLDLRCGGEGVKLRGRTLPAASVVFRRSGTTAFQALQRFFKELCPAPVLPDHPVYGSNNWYYAYGNSSHQDILQDADYLASLTQGLENRPYMVIDDGWQSLHNMEPGYNGGPWRAGNEKFPDMGALAREIAKRGARPGIWIRLLWNRDPQIPENWRSKRDREYLDPTVPEVLSYIQEDLRTLRRWGYELIKHDFSTYDIFGRWGFQMGSQITEGGWRFADETVTSAEAVLNFYKAVREAAGSGLILGCNCIGHLGAGLMHLNRTGDDTSGRSWEQTRKMGVNTLSFSLPQHGALFAIDADCVGVTGFIARAGHRHSHVPVPQGRGHGVPFHRRQDKPAHGQLLLVKHLPLGRQPQAEGQQGTEEHPQQGPQRLDCSHASSPFTAFSPWRSFPAARPGAPPAGRTASYSPAAGRRAGPCGRRGP